MKQITDNSKQRLGFTIIEMVIVIAMLAIISGISIANFRTGETRKRVALASDSIINAVRVAQNYTLSGKRISSAYSLVPPSPGGCADQAPLDYKINFTSAATFNLYVEDKCNPVSVYLIQQFQLPVNTQIAPSGLALNNLSVNTLDIKFNPPFAVVSASGNGANFASFTTASITVRSSDGAASRTVVIDGVSGKIGE